MASRLDDTAPAMSEHNVSSDEDVALVRRAFSAYAAGHVEALLAVLDPDVEIKSLMTEAERAIYRGHEGAREWLAAIYEVFPDWRPSVTSVRAVRGGVVTEFVANATAIGSGVRIEQRYWHATRVRHGKVTWFGFFRTEREAVDALDQVA